jgi:hypothetical protein
MVRMSLIAAALLAVTAPCLTAQSALPEAEEWTWSANRPDANATIGVIGARTLAATELEITYRFEQLNSQGVWFGSDSLNLETTLDVYDDAPLNLSDIRHHVRIAYGITDNLTIMARGEFAVLERATIANNGLLRTGVNDFGDVHAGLMYSIYSSGPYRLQLEAGGVIPTGASTTYADTTAAQTGTETPLPYDMRPGGGTFAATGGISGTVQNEWGSLGAQFRLRANLGQNDAGFTPGDQYLANGWAAYNINQSISVSAGVRWENWDNIDGGDDRLNQFGDPHNNGGILAGQRASMPVGINLMMPEDSRLAGHRLSLEAVYALHHDYEGPQLGLDWGVNVGWTVAF